MKLTNRIKIGFGVLVALPAALIVFQIVEIHRLRTAADDPARPGLRTAMAALQLIQDEARIEEYTRRFFAAAAPGGATELAACGEDFDAGLRTLQTTVRSERERLELDRLEKFWQAFKANLALQQQSHGPKSPREVPPSVQDDLDRLRSQTQTAFQADVGFMNTTRERIQAESRRAEFLCWSVLAIGLLLGSLTALLVVRSISAPLKQLVEGTQALAEGKDFVRLDTSRDDEAGLIAKAVNSLAARLKKTEAGKQSGRGDA
jgi:methyl-accepting chemotaxis protein